MDKQVFCTSLKGRIFTSLIEKQMHDSYTPKWRVNTMETVLNLAFLGEIGEINRE